MAVFSVFLISYLTGLFDNGRYESVISKTDGLFKIKDELARYFKSNIASDIIAAAIPGLIFIPLTLPAYSEIFLDYFGDFLAPHFHLTSAFSPFGAYFVVFITALAARLTVMPFALKRYRALWLTSFVES